jgi:adenylate cyclase
MGFWQKAFKGDHLLLLATGLALSLLMAALYYAQPGLLKFLDYKIYDQLLTHYQEAKPSGVPVIVDIDEKSLAETGQWPWPRYRVALLLAKIRNAGAAAVGLDILFAEPDRTSPELLRKQLKDELFVDVGFTGLPKALENNDQVLAGVLGAGPYVLGTNFLFGRQAKAVEEARHAPPCDIPGISVASLGGPDSLPLTRCLPPATDLTCPVPALSAAAPGFGFINVNPDQDGVIRRVPLLIAWQDKLYPSLALATLMQATGDASILIKRSPLGIDSFRYGKVVLPVDANGRLLIKFRGKAKHFPYLSAVDILKDRVDPSSLQGKIAFIGTSAAGLMDIRTTPFDATYPGVETHATIIDSILAQDFVSVPDSAFVIELCALLLCGVVITLMLAWTKALWVLLVVVAACAGLWTGTVHLFTAQKAFISPLYSYLTLGLNYGVLTLLKFWREEKQRKFIHGAFSHYLAPAVISRIMESPETLSLSGEEKEVTIMFTDVRGFTTLSEKLTPTQVTDLLHDYLTPMTRIIKENLGTLDKFIGDAIMAFWNAPLDVPGHQKRALDSGLRMLNELDKLNELFKVKFGFPIAIGIGVHSGRVRVGNMGSADLFDYTLIGDNVNLTSRLEGLTKYYGQAIVVSEAIAEQCRDGYAFQELDSVRVKGKAKPVTVYTVVPAGQIEQKKPELERYGQALAQYKAGSFTEALEAFRALSRDFGEHTLYTLYAERCETLAKEPPETWDGVYTHKTK